MAGNGPPAQSSHTRSRNDVNRATIKSDGKLGGFDLPDDVLPEHQETGVRESWHPQTVRWWNAWRASPQSTRMMTEPDWEFLLDTALMHHQMWAKGRWDFAAEVRLRVAKFGATPEDRMRLKVEVEIPEEFPAGNAVGTNVTSIRDRRDKILNQEAAGE